MRERFTVTDVIVDNANLSLNVTNAISSKKMREFFVSFQSSCTNFYITDVKYFMYIILKILINLINKKEKAEKKTRI